MELQDHLSHCAAHAETVLDAQCIALEQELESAKSMVASRDMLAAQWGLGALLGEQPEFGGMRVAHDMLNAR
eukprot:6718684-Prorocentrum_lima.AAC.1